MQKSLLLTPAETAQAICASGRNKANMATYKQFILGILAGAFIAFAAQGSTVAIHNIASVGVAKALAGAIFACGLIMVVFTGSELFTGNSLMFVALLEKNVSLSKLLKNYGVVFLGNLVGSLIIVLCVFLSGQLNFSTSALGGFAIKTAVTKVSLPFTQCLFMGILCNWLVCVAVWLATCAQDASGKILGIFFPIWLFIASGFEHSIANMYYIPIGMLAKTNPVWAQAALDMGVAPEKLAALNLSGFLHNIVPVTIGNVIGGVVFVSAALYLAYIWKKPAESLDPANASATSHERLSKDN